MPIPNNMQRTHVLNVIRQIDAGRIIPSRRHARKVALRSNQRDYPVKILISWGHEVATGRELNYKSFVTQEALKYLTNLGFTVVYF